MLTVLWWLYATAGTAMQPHLIKTVPPPLHWVLFSVSRSLIPLTSPLIPATELFRRVLYLGVGWKRRTEEVRVVPTRADKRPEKDLQLKRWRGGGRGEGGEGGKKTTQLSKLRAAVLIFWTCVSSRNVWRTTSAHLASSLSSWWARSPFCTLPTSHDWV